VPEPAALTGPPEQIERAFRDAHLLLDRRIVLFLKFATGESRRNGISKEVDRIGKFAG
jgi:hypothetical protein